jgi:hypothetical protein
MKLFVPLPHPLFFVFGEQPVIFLVMGVPDMQVCCAQTKFTLRSFYTYLDRPPFKLIATT